MNIGIFSGSFNPIHVGHLALANYLCEYEGLDELWFMVSPHNPLKAKEGLMEDTVRLHLVQMAIEGYPKFKASDFEFGLPQPSYTVHTLDKLNEVYPQHCFHLIIGSDNWIVFHQWREWKRILQQNRLIVYPRPGYSIDESSLPPHVRVSHAPVFEISSTFIRNALQDGKDIRYFLHPQVYQALCATR